ncbi:hypothetical protein NJ7G_3051 [Natrinema sp. J7-2]|nr:hypothetical protein NJ7G_3051 [Natrinema sp. J7-2]
MAIPFDTSGRPVSFYLPLRLPLPPVSVGIELSRSMAGEWRKPKSPVS